MTVNGNKQRAYRPHHVPGDWLAKIGRGAGECQSHPDRRGERLIGDRLSFVCNDQQKIPRNQGMVAMA